MDLLERARLQHKVGTTAPPETKKRGEQHGQQQHQQQEQGVASFGAAAAAHRGRSTASPKAVSGQVSDKLRARSRQSTISTNGRTSTVITTSSIFTTEKTADATKTRETTETENMAEEEETTVEALAAASGSEDGMSVTEEPVMMLYPDLPLTSETPPFLPERPRSGSPVIPEGKLTTEIPETSTLTAEEIFTIGTAATTESVERGTQIPSETSTASQPEATITVKLAATETEPTPPTATTLRESSTTSTEMETTFYDEEKMEATTRNPGWSSPERRPKRIRTDGGDRDQEVDVIHSGQYHEVNPGQYREVHPGQYHEQNPGQYHEVRLSTKVI